MTTALKQLFLFYVVVTLSALLMSTSALYFPYIEPSEQIKYFELAISLLLLFIPLSFMISIFKLAKK